MAQVRQNTKLEAKPYGHIVASQLLELVGSANANNLRFLGPKEPDDFASDYCSGGHVGSAVSIL
jgi:hypothetical protein